MRQIRRRSDGKYDVIPSDKDGGTFDAVIATTAPQTFLELTPDLPASMREKLARVRYKANVCVLLELTGPLSPYYWISIAQPDWPFVAVIEHTNLLPAQRYGGTIVYLSRYIDERDRLYQADDAAVCDLFLKHLQIMFPAFHRGGVANARVYRSRFAQPVIVTGYSQLIADWKMPAPLDNLYLASMAQIFPEDRGQNYAVRTARQVVEMIDGRR